MRDPRFQIRSVGGFGMGSGEGGGRGNRKPSYTWYVMDTAYCWEIVATKHTEHEAQWEADRFNERYPGLVEE